MSFSDVFKNKFLAQFAITSPIEYVLALVFSILVGLIIYFVYKKTYNGVAYSHNFNMSLILMTLITTIIIFTITANPVSVWWARSPSSASARWSRIRWI